jgi:hypothetical protein
MTETTVAELTNDDGDDDGLQGPFSPLCAALAKRWVNGDRSRVESEILASSEPTHALHAEGGPLALTLGVLSALRVNHGELASFDFAAAMMRPIALSMV